ncbi:MAG: ceramidase domain-containing protein [Gammaproteobacteria bacterium]
MSSSATEVFGYRHLILGVLVVITLLGVMMLEPIPQDIRYHDFADKRAFFGIPNAFDVLSNLPFLLIGIWGSVICARQDLGPMRIAWLIFFVGVALVSAGSAYYHLSPSNPTLAWDRLPMTIGFMAVFCALLGERVNVKLGQRLLIPMLVLGAVSVAHWAWTDDLRLYAWVQFMPLVILPIVLATFARRYSHQWYLLAALFWYLLAKVTEFLDPQILALTGGAVSGHTLKHLAAAVSCYCVLLMLRKRQPLS